MRYHRSAEGSYGSRVKPGMTDVNDYRIAARSIRTARFTYSSASPRA